MEDKIKKMKYAIGYIYCDNCEWGDEGGLK